MRKRAYYDSIVDTPLFYKFLTREHEELPPLSATVHDSVNYYLYDPNDDTVDFSGAYGRAIHPPIVDGGGVPADNAVAEKISITERVTKLQDETDANPHDMSEMLCYEDEFVNQFITSLHPLSLEDVLDKQKRPSQLLDYYRQSGNLYGDYDLHVKSFIKHEAMVEKKPGRVISSVNPEHRIRLSSYALPLSDHLKSQPWYAFGMQPSAIADRLYELAEQTDELIETDYSKFDGRHGESLHRFEKKVLLEAFGPEAAALIDKEHNLKATAKYGTRYTVNYSRLSGSPITSVLNTVDNCYVVYASLRTQGMTVERAIANLGIYGGDDGVTPGLDMANFERVAALYKCKLTPVVRHMFDYVSFLGRVYLDPWTTNASIYDLRRFICKAHLIVASKDVDLPTAACRKATGFAVTDSETPLIKQWIDYVRSKYGKGSGYIDDIGPQAPYFAKFIWDTGVEPFPQLDHREALVNDVVNELIGLDWEKYLDFDSCEFSKEPDEGLPYVFRGQLYNLETPTTTTTTNDSNSQRNTTVTPKSGKGAKKQISAPTATKGNSTASNVKRGNASRSRKGRRKSPPRSP
jgi:hypothetical protein